MTLNEMFLPALRVPRATRLAPLEAFWPRRGAHRHFTDMAMPPGNRKRLISPGSGSVRKSGSGFVGTEFDLHSSPPDTTLKIDASGKTFHISPLGGPTMKNASLWFVFAVAMLCVAPALYAHCEIPCGIYDDRARTELMMEHTRTIEKSMNTIKELRAQEDKNYNQLVRWINNKEEHARKLQNITWQYFMTQRITPAEGSGAKARKYVHEVTLLHQILVQAMKTKQTTDLKHVENLRSLIGEFEASYFGEKPKAPEKKHRHEGSGTRHEGSHSH
jgi:nickel superoxide dismutase